MTNRTNHLHTASIVAITGCTCSPEVRWFDCYCATTRTNYDAFPLNWREVMSEGARPSAIPTIEAVADIIKKHPDAKIRYVGGDDRIFGEGKDGSLRHIDLARQLAKK